MRRWMMKTTALFIFSLILLTVGSTTLPGQAASTYKACSLLTAVLGSTSVTLSIMDAKGFAFSSAVFGAEATPQQLKSLADKAAGRLP